MWGGSFQLCRALIIYKCAARRSWIHTWSWIFIQTWAQALEQRTRDVSDDDPTRRRSVCLCMKVRKHLQLLLWFCWCSWLKRRAQRWSRSLITSNNSLVCWSTVEETSHETNWSLLSGADLWWSIMTTAKKEVRWSRAQRECVQVSWRPSARYSNSYITSLHQDESALTSVRWNDWSVEDLRSARWHNGFRSSLAVSLFEVFIPSHLRHIVLIILCPVSYNTNTNIMSSLQVWKMKIWHRLSVVSIQPSVWKRSRTKC